MDHISVAVLRRFFKNLLPVEQASLVEQHVRGCAMCADKLERVQAALAVAEQHVAQEQGLPQDTEPEVTGSIQVDEERLRRELADWQSRRAPTAPARQPGWGYRPWMAAAAALLVSVGGLGLWSASTREGLDVSVVTSSMGATRSAPQGRARVATHEDRVEVRVPSPSQVRLSLRNEEPGLGFVLDAGPSGFTLVDGVPAGGLHVECGQTLLFPPEGSPAWTVSEGGGGAVELAVVVVDEPLSPEVLTTLASMPAELRGRERAWEWLGEVTGGVVKRVQIDTLSPGGEP